MGLAEDVERLKTRRRNVRPQDLHRLLLQAGFTRRFGRGDHWVYRHPHWSGRRLVVDPRTPLLPAYVSKAIRAIEEALE
ncbi:MAG: type II toxin-antitoxin system HicA family toxin [Dehalococcoidia bacterium]|nr:type II toxin-antitoxin system HicA family toxin [Dehalococcoidia bacterium]MYA54251.1 type II toxin-antitoxin system HicA family toxin [Dehalococcoidia bacterium]